MTAIVPVASIVGMIVTLIIAVGLPIVLAIIVGRKWHANIKCLLLGMACFLIFALILEQILHTIVQLSTGNLLIDNVFLRAIYGGLAAALFEETGRFVVMKYFMKKEMKKENALMFGVGHGGIESIIIVGMTYVSNIITAIMINTGGLEKFLGTLNENTMITVEKSLEPLWTTPSSSFYLAGLERVSAIAFHICASYLVYRAVKDKKISFYFIAFLLHFAMDAGVVLLSNAIPQIALVELMLLAFVAVLVVITRSLFINEE